jgi:hypothetical protein
MNQTWREILRNRGLASIRIHRTPTDISQPPYIHFLFREEWAEPWMENFDSPIPSNWLAIRGFSHMEHYAIKIGVLHSTMPV